MSASVLTHAVKQSVRMLREEGWTWDEIVEITGIAKRTVQRAIKESEHVCAHRGCFEKANLNGKLCPEHARIAMRYRPGGGERQQEVMRQMRHHGHLTSEQLRQLTGIDSPNLGQIMRRLVHLGLVERPMRGHFTLPRDQEWKPEKPILPTPDRVGTTR